MVKQKNEKRVEAGKTASAKNKWIKEVIKIMKQTKSSFKDSMQIGSAGRKMIREEPVTPKKVDKIKVKTEKIKTPSK